MFNTQALMHALSYAKYMGDIQMILLDEHFIDIECSFSMISALMPPIDNSSDKNCYIFVVVFTTAILRVSLLDSIISRKLVLKKIGPAVHTGSSKFKTDPEKSKT